MIDPLKDSAYFLGLADAMRLFDRTIQENETLGNHLVCGQLRFVRALIQERYETLEVSMIRYMNEKRQAEKA